MVLWCIHMDFDICSLIRRRRRQILLHSYLYYELNENLIPDSTFDKWMYELVELQKTYPEESEAAEFYEEFKDFKGASGSNLPYKDPQIMDEAHRLLHYLKGM